MPMDSKARQTTLETRLDEFWALDELEGLVHQKNEVDQERATSLRALRQSVAPEYCETTISSTRAQFLRQIDDDLEAHTAKHQLVTLLSELESSPSGQLWANFRHHLVMIEEAKKDHSKALQIAEEHIRPALFWAQVAQAELWIDLKLPREDILFRASVNRLNGCRDAAFKFYEKEGRNLLIHHKRRLTIVNEILGIPSSPNNFSPNSSECHTEPSEVSVGSLKSGFDETEDIRGSFNPVEYINFMNDGKKGIPIFGSDLSSFSGVLAKQILGAPHGNHALSPPLPILTPPSPEVGSIVDSMKRAFKLEEYCSRGRIYPALQSITNPQDGGPQLDKGWLLGLVLVNLPIPLIYLNEERVRAFRNSLPRDQITFIFQKGTREYGFFKELWPRTDGVNIQLAASAITQVKGAEKIMCDIRSKWQIEVGVPLPAHRRWSEDEGSGRLSRLLSPRRQSSERSGRSAAN